MTKYLAIALVLTSVVGLTLLDVAYRVVRRIRDRADLRRPGH